MSKQESPEVSYRTGDGRYLIIFKCSPLGDRVHWIDFWGQSLNLSLEEFAQAIKREQERRAR